MERLNFHPFTAVQPLFAALSETQPMCASVLAGSYPGRVYVDDPAAPRSALLLTYIESEAAGIWAFLAGDPSNAPFNQDVNAALFAGQLFSPRTPMLFWTCDPGDWGGQMQAIFHPYPPIWSPRCHFIAHRAQYNWRSTLPAGFTVEPLTDELRQQAELPPDLATTLEKWQNLAQEGYTARGFQDYGFVTLDVRHPTPVISSWATVDFISGGRGDLGFFTQPDYRQRGLGTIAVAAALEEGFRRGLQQVNWTCEADNPGSYRTAQKLGLERIADYSMAFLMLDPQRHAEIYQQMLT